MDDGAATPALATALTACPKSMTYGPCGGVTPTGACEVDPAPCVFLERATVPWPMPVRTPPTDPTRQAHPTGPTGPTGPAHPTHPAGGMRQLLATRPVVVADFPARALDAHSLAACARTLAGHVDAVLVGDAGNARVQFPPAYRAHLIQTAGVAAWSGLTCRDRNRVAMEGELAALAHVGVAGVHCVTGDHTLTGHRPDARAVFDLDSTQAAHLARTAGLLVSVAEAPASPPVGRRPQRLLEKMRAGAEICFVNHAGGVAPVAEFISQAKHLGVTMGFVPCIPIVVDRESAGLLATFTSLVIPEGYLEAIVAAPDPLAAGIRAAAGLADALMALDGVVGVNLSGGPGPGGELRFAEALAAVADRIGVTRAGG